MFFFDDNNYVLRKGDPIGERLSKVAKDQGKSVEGLVQAMLAEKTKAIEGAVKAARSAPPKAAEGP